MNNDYIDETIKIIINALDNKQFQNTVHYKKLKEIEEKREKGKK